MSNAYSQPWRRRCLVLLAAALAPARALPAPAGEINIVSDPVGFVRVELAPTNEALVSLPFQAFNPDIQSLFQGQLKGATNEAAADAIRRWESGAQTEAGARKADGFGDPARDGVWFSDFSAWETSTLAFFPGEAFWIRNNQQVLTQNVFLCGAVPLESASTVSLLSGWNLFAYPFCAKIGLNATALRDSGAYGAAPVENADQVHDPLENISAWLLDDPGAPNHGKWVDATTNASALELRLGRGYWYYRAPTNSFDWAEPRPYAGAFALNTNPPVVTAMVVNSNAGEIALTIETTGDAGETLEVYFKDLAATGGLDNALWRIAATGIAVNGASSVRWTDAGSPSRGKVNTVYGRCYLVGRGDVDSDGDNLPDARERFALGTDPFKADTDGDGLSDGVEIALGTNPREGDTDHDGIGDGAELEFGRNPLVADPYTALPFAEHFETNTCAVGDLNGQNDWTAEPSGAALVRTQCVHAGSQTLRIFESNPAACRVRHLFLPPSAPEVWGDFYSQAVAAELPSGAITGSAVFCFNDAGRLVVYDGHRAEGDRWVTLTNQAPVSTGTWVRLTVKLDYTAQEWDLFLNTARVARGVGFASYRQTFLAFGVDAGQALLDDANLSTTIPEGIDQDQDGLPDWWEMEHFGNLNQTTLGDLDGDGLANLAEYQAGTDPTAADTDGDGLNDALELYFGNDPLSSNAYARLPFVENFETNTCAIGDLNGQHGWEASPAGAALVQTGVVYEGRQALALNAGSGAAARTRHLFAPGAESVVWLDFHTRAIPAATAQPGSAGAMLFDAYGRLCLYDGQLGRWINVGAKAVEEGTWVRLTVKINYGQRTWRLFQDGIRVADNAGFAEDFRAFTGFALEGQEGYVDQIGIGTSQPPSGDMDGDGLPDLAEADVYGTDPLNADSDGDGVDDGMELANGTNPLVADQGSSPNGPRVNIVSPAEGERILY